MKYIWYSFLGLFSLGFLGSIAALGLMVYVINDLGKDLPDYSQLKDYRPPVVTRLYAGDGRLMEEYAQEKRVFVPIDVVPDHVKQAFIAAEDKNFYEHEGVDYFAVLRAAVTNLRNAGQGRRPEGASTITQQVAKNFLLTNEVSYKRKVREAILAYRMERAMSKERLLELYLNEIYFGSGAYGLAAAALRYFDKSLEELNVSEAAYLAALPKAPNNYHPVDDYDAALARRNWVIGRMEDDGYITEGEAELAVAYPLKMADTDRAERVSAPYFAEEVRRELMERYGERGLYGGGLAVRTTLDPKLQDIAIRALRDGLMAYDQRHGYRGPLEQLSDTFEWWESLRTFERPEAFLPHWKLAVVLSSGPSDAEIGFQNSEKAMMRLEDVKWAREYRNQGYALGPEITAVNQVLSRGDVIMVEPVGDGDAQRYELRQVPDIQGGLIALDPHTGRILAMQGGWTYDISEFNRATQALRQPGSAFKPLVYLAALENGFTPATLVLDAPFVIEDRPGNIWRPSNYSNEFYGPTPIRVGVEKSKNLMTVRLADHLGMDLIADYAVRFGVVDSMEPHLANSLGAAETTLLRMTLAYAQFVNGGKKVVPTFIDRVQERRGSTIFIHDTRPCENCGDLIQWGGQSVPDLPDTREQLVDPRAAYQIVSILEGVVERGTGMRIKSLGRPLAGKTGTTNRSHDAWFIGFSPDLVVGVFAGFDQPRSLGKRETGSSVAVPIFKDFMEAALDGTPATPFRMPPGIRNVQINADNGARARPGDSRVIWESFITGTEPTDQMFILDGGGINLMKSSAFGTGLSDNSPAAQSATTGTGGLY